MKHETCVGKHVWFDLFGSFLCKSLSFSEVFRSFTCLKEYAPSYQKCNTYHFFRPLFYFPRVSLSSVSSYHTNVKEATCIATTSSLPGSYRCFQVTATQVDNGRYGRGAIQVAARILCIIVNKLHQNDDPIPSKNTGVYWSNAALCCNREYWLFSFCLFTA